MTLIAFSGLKTSGKDTAARVLIDEFGYTKIALADSVRDFAYAVDPIVDVDIEMNIHNDCGCIAKHPLATKTEIRLQHLIDHFGWDYCKEEYPEVRRLMKAIGTEGARNLFGQDFWIDQLLALHPNIDDAETRYVITDVRFENEANLVLGHNGVLIWIDRPGREPDGHASESTVCREMAHVILNNNFSVEELQKSVRSLVSHEVITTA